MHLNEYLLKSHISSEAFAKKLRVSVSSVSKWRIKNRLPRPAMALKIERATRGRVTLRDWYR